MDNIDLFAQCLVENKPTSMKEIPKLLKEYYQNKESESMSRIMMLTELRVHLDKVLLAVRKQDTIDMINKMFDVLVDESNWDDVDHKKFVEKIDRYLNIKSHVVMLNEGKKDGNNHLNKILKKFEEIAIKIGKKRQQYKLDRGKMAVKFSRMFSEFKKLEEEYNMLRNKKFNFQLIHKAEDLVYRLNMLDEKITIWITLVTGGTGLIKESNVSVKTSNKYKLQNNETQMRTEILTKIDKNRPYKIEFAGSEDKGLKKKNEDFFKINVGSDIEPFRSNYGERTDKVIIRYYYFCVCDGHGDNQIWANYIGTNLIKHLNPKRKKLTDEYIKKTCKVLEDDVYEEYEETIKYDPTYFVGGTTCNAVILIPEEKGIRVICINIGDCRCIIYDGNEIKQLSIDQNADNPKERERVERSGGQVHKHTVGNESANYFIGQIPNKGMTGLQVSRSFGDFESKKYIKGIISKPEITRDFIPYSSLKEYIIVVGSDGLWGSKLAKKIDINRWVIQKVRKIQNLEDTVEHIVLTLPSQKLTHDNISVIAVRISSRKDKKEPLTLNFEEIINKIQKFPRIIPRTEETERIKQEFNDLIEKAKNVIKEIIPTKQYEKEIREMKLSQLRKHMDEVLLVARRSIIIKMMNGRFDGLVDESNSDDVDHENFVEKIDRYLKLTFSNYGEMLDDKFFLLNKNTT